MTPCHLLRHGSTGFEGFRGRLDDPLTTQGWQQMQQAIATPCWARLISSPRQRCLSFAEELSRQQNLPLTVDENLGELDFGEWEGRTAAEIAVSDEHRLTQFWRDPWQYPPPGGETMTLFAQRIQRAWVNLQQLASPTLVITHGGVIRYLHHWLTGSERSDLLDFPVPHGSLHRVNDWPLNESHES